MTSHKKTDAEILNEHFKGMALEVLMIYLVKIKQQKRELEVVVAEEVEWEVGDFA